MYLIFTLAFIIIELIGNNICLGLPDCGVRSQNLLPQEQLTAKRRDVAIGQYPWVVAIYIAEDDKCDKYKQICGGTIINENWVVTAGHCVCSFNPGVYRIHAGFNDSSELTVPSAKIYEVSNIFMHPDFAYYNLVNDIALLRTSKPIDISTGDININRICLPSADEAIGSKIAAAGWVEDLKADKKKTLRRARASVIENSVCNDAYDADPSDANNYIDENVICTARRTRHDCFANSGGPLMQKNGAGAYTLIGIVSYGYNCLVSPQSPRPPYILPGVHVNVPKYVKWIQDIISQPEDAEPTFSQGVYYCFNIDNINCTKSENTEENDDEDEDEEDNATGDTEGEP